MKLEELQAEIVKDCNISEDLVAESRKVPTLHGKYLSFKSQEYLILKNLEMQIDVIEMQRWLFYTGKATPEEYKAEKFELKLLKTDVDIFMKADKKIQDVKGRIEVQKAKISMLDEMIRALNQRTFLIKNIIEEKRFQNGLN